MLLMLFFEAVILFLISANPVPIIYMVVLAAISCLHHSLVKNYKPMFGIIISSLTLFLVFTIEDHHDFLILWCVISLHIWYLDYCLSTHNPSSEPLMKTLIIISGFVPCWHAINAVPAAGFLQAVFLSLGSFAVLLFCWLSVQADFNTAKKPAKWLMLKLMLLLCVTLMLSFTAGRLLYTKTIKDFFARLQNTWDFEKDLDLSGRLPGRSRLPDDFSLNTDSSKNSTSVNAFIQQKREAGEPRLRLPIYLRKSGYAEFSGGKWLPAKVSRDNWAFDEDDGSDDGWTVVGNVRTNITTDYVVYLSEPGSSSVFCLPGTVAVGLPKVFKGSDQTYRMERPRRNMISYAAHSYMLKYYDIENRNLKPGMTGNKYLELPANPLMNKLKKDTNLLTGGAVNTMDKISKLKKYMSSRFTYEQKLSKPRKNMLENFLYGERKGNCTLFATAFALYLRAAGIPSRVGTGYCSSTYDLVNDVYVFYNDDAHAWTEVCLEDYGWVIVDATPQSGYVSKNERYHDFADSRDNFNYISGADTLAHRFRGTNQRGSLAMKQTGFYFYILILVCAIISLVFMMIKSFSRFKQLDQGKRRGSGKETELTFFSHFCRFFAEKGVRRKKGETAMEYYLRLKNMQVLNSEFDDMLPYYYSVKYENSAPSLDFEKGLIQKIQSMRNNN